MSITATQAARALRHADGMTLLCVPGTSWTPTWWDSDTRQERDLTASEIRRGRRFIEREDLHRAAVEARWEAEERAYEHELQKQRRAADVSRRRAAQVTCQKVLAARG